MDRQGPPEKPSAGVLIVVPVLNEAGNVEPLLDGIHRELTGVPHTVCLIDDGSIDGTVEMIRARMQAPDHRLHLIQRIKRQRGSQRGSALLAGLRWGLEHTEHTVFVEMDGDGSHRPEELPAGIEMVGSGRADVVIASKFVSGGREVNRTAGRRMVSRICSVAVRTLIASRVIDYSNGYRFYTREAAGLAAPYRFRYGSPIYLTELLALWLRARLRVREFPTLYVGRHEGLSKLRLIDLMKAGLAVFEIALRYHVTGFGALGATGKLAAPATERSPRTRAVAGDE